MSTDARKPKYYVTTAIDYVNDLPHLGTAYEKVCADVIARYMRLKGGDAFFSMGNDEHSQNVMKAATQRGLAPDKYCEGMAAAFKATWKGIEVSFDGFIRTSEPRHERAVHEVFRRISARGDIYKSKYAGWYCVSCEGFLQEEDLVDGKCQAHRMAPAWIEEENMFFALSKYAEPLLAHIEGHPEFIQPETRRNEIVSFIQRGLKDVSVSRSGVTWGMSVPGDPEHVFYVWFDALINYLTAVGFPDDRERFERYWPADLHVIGKDITRFHCILWPAMLMSAGIALPKTVFGHGFLSFRGERLSKTLGNIINPLDVVEKYGADPLRYFMAREIVFGKDGDFSWEQFINRYNSELANDLGNLVSRATNMMKQYFEGKVPEPPERAGSDGEMRRSSEKARDAYFRAMDCLEIHNGISEIFAVVRDANRYIEENAPWALVKKPDGAKVAASVLFDVCEVLRSTAVLLFPFMPSKSQEIWRVLGIDGQIAAGNFESALAWRESWAGVSSGIGAIRSLFPRIEADKEAAPAAAGAGEDDASGRGAVKEKREEGRMTPEEGASPQPSGLLDISEFKKLDLRVAHIKSASAVPGASKLLKLFIDIGGEERQIVAGIAEHYQPEELTGKNIIVITNLKPARIRGVDSNGMLLATTDGGRVILLVPDKPAAPGSKIS
jgi:methionyl-tRNA synthetase